MHERQYHHRAQIHNAAQSGQVSLPWDRVSFQPLFASSRPIGALNMLANSTATSPTRNTSPSSLSDSGGRGDSWLREDRLPGHFRKDL